jgi:PAS domain S-box-containing protein
MPGALDQVAIVAVTDVKGTIVYANEQFARISKYATHELIGQNHRILNSGEHSAAFFKAMYRTIAKGRVWRGELRNRAKDGSHYWVDTWVIPAVSQSGKIVRYISIGVDITARKEAEAQQAELASELKRQNDAIAHMTQHDALTGLPNRLLLLERLRYALTGLSEAAGIAVLLIDLASATSTIRSGIRPAIACSNWPEGGSPSASAVGTRPEGSVATSSPSFNSRRSRPRMPPHSRAAS